MNINIRKSATGLGLAIVLGAPLASLAGGFWETTNDEAGSRIVAPQFGTIAKTSPPANVTPLQPGAVSDDRQFVYLGEESGWQLRPMQYEIRNGRLAHVDDPVGHMERHADNTPPTELQRKALERSGGA